MCTCISSVNLHEESNGGCIVVHTLQDVSAPSLPVPVSRWLEPFVPAYGHCGSSPAREEGEGKRGRGGEGKRGGDVSSAKQLNQLVCPLTIILSL